MVESSAYVMDHGVVRFLYDSGEEREGEKAVWFEREHEEQAEEISHRSDEPTQKHKIRR